MVRRLRINDAQGAGRNIVQATHSSVPWPILDGRA
jgi:hypothetical protein